MAQKIRFQPRISLNKLGEYMTATASRRRKIIQDQKYPPDFQVARYAEAERAIIEYLLSGRDRLRLARAISAIRSTVPSSDFERERIQLCLEAIYSFDSIPFNLNGLALSAVEQRPPMMFAGVEVSVRPNLAVVAGNGKQGAVKLYFAKTHPLDQKSGEYVAAALWKDLAAARPSVSVDSKLIFVVDVFAQQVFTAPKSTQKRMIDIEAACQEICARWPTV